VDEGVENIGFAHDRHGPVSDDAAALAEATRPGGR